MNALLAYLHHLAAFTMVFALAIELALIREPLSVRTARTIQIVDLFYGIAALLILIAGPIRLLYFEKPPLFYLYNAPFLVKIAILIGVGMLSIYPTLTFLSWRKATDKQQVPQVPAAQRKLIEKLVTIQIAGIAAAVLFAAMAAKGIGVFGP